MIFYEKTEFLVTKEAFKIVFMNNNIKKLCFEKR